MSEFTDIESRIKQLDGGAFQNLCDAYLFCEGYGREICALGMKAGTNKTAKGTPDTYLRTENGKYVLAMYTTQERNFLKKALEDLEKCFDPEKTGLQMEDIEEIVYCYTYGRLSAGDSKKLHDFCEERGVELRLIGLGELSKNLSIKYPIIAREFLGIGGNAGQVMSVNEFVLMHDAKKLAAPLGTEFLFRSEELQAAKEKLKKSDVLVFSGPAGVGKTRLALQFCKEAAAENKYDILCIRNNGSELCNELFACMEHDKDYLIFIDDANELTELRFVVEYLAMKKVGMRHVQKIVMTVRDYARNQVLKKIGEVEKPEILRVGLLPDAEIQKLVEKAYGIRNHACLERIAAIADGNARLAMLAGKVAVQSDSISAIQDATELYEYYYKAQIDIIINNETGVTSAAVMAFFQTLRLDALEALQPIFDALNLTKNQFIADLKQFHELELVDLCHDTAAKISDQSFGNYLIKYAFVDKKIISLGKMIQESFFINEEKTISACNVLLNVFSDNAVYKYVIEQVGHVWDALVNDEQKFEPFFQAFCILRPEKTLMRLRDLIEAEPLRIFDVRSIAFRKEDSPKNIEDGIISKLCSFRTDIQFPTAIELLLEYFQKRPDLFEQVYSAFVLAFGVRIDIEQMGYFTQKVAVEKLCEMAKLTATDNFLILFVRVAEQFLKFNFSHMESGRRNTVTFYRISLTKDEVVLQY